MHTEKYVFAQIVSFLPQRQFRRIVQKNMDSNTYYLIAIIKHDLKLDRSVFEVMRILGSSLLVEDSLPELFFHRQEDVLDDGQLEFVFNH